MSALPDTSPVITINLHDLEAMLQRVVRQAVHEELAEMLRKSSILDDWEQEGPDDPAGDEELLAEALHIREGSPRQGWEDFKAELSAAEVAGELPS